MKKILLLLLVLMSTLMSVSAFLNDAEVYYSFDNTSNVCFDNSGNLNSCTNNGATNTIGKLNNGMDFDGVGDSLTTPSISLFGNAFTFNQWIKQDVTIGQIFTYRPTSGNVNIVQLENVGDELRILIANSAGTIFKDYRTTSLNIQTGTWYFVSSTWDGTNLKLYVNGVERTDLNKVTDNTGLMTNTPRFLRIGKQNDVQTTNTFNGVMDEFSIYDRALSLSEIEELYNSGNGYNPYAFAKSITFNNPQQDQVLNSTSFLLNVSFAEITNATYILNDGLETFLCSDCLESSNTTLVGVEGLNNLTILTDSGTLYNQSISFTIDTFNPTITNNLPLEINSYLLEFNGTTCTDVNLDTCTLTIQGNTYDLLTLDNATLTFNGNFSYVIEATDLAGNSLNETGNLFVNPYQYFRVAYNSTFLTNFTLNDRASTGEYVSFLTYNDGLNLGNNTLSFVKNGYVSNNFTIELTNSSNFNQTFSVSPVTLFVKVYEYGETTPLTFSVVIENSTSIQTYNSITELNKMYSEIPTGDIKLTVSSTGYSNGIFYNTLTPFTSLIFNVYLFPENSSNIVTFTITDFDTRNFLEDVTIEARAVVNNTETTVQQTKTTASGVSYLILDTLVDYNFYFSKEGYTQAVIDSIPGVTSYNIRLKKEAISFAFVNGVNVRYFPQSEIVYKNTTYTYKAQVQGESITSTTYTLYDNLNNTIYTSTSTNPTGSSFEYTYNLPLSSNVTKLYQKIVYSVNGNSFTDIKEYKVYTLSSTDIENILSFGQSTDEESQFIKFFVILIAYVITILIGMNFQFTQNYVSMLTLLPTVLFTWFGWIPLLYGTVIFIATIALYIGGNKRL